MTCRISQWTLDVLDVDTMASFWAEALGYRIDKGEDGNATLHPPDDSPAGTLTVWLQATTQSKKDKNRGHPDLNSVSPSVETEVARLLELGAIHADVGQKPSDPFVVLRDPEGNEFCVLRNEPR